MQKRTPFPSFCRYKIAIISVEVFYAYTSVIPDCFQWLSYNLRNFGNFSRFMMYNRFIFSQTESTNKSKQSEVVIMKIEKKMT